MRARNLAGYPTWTLRGTLDTTATPTGLMRPATPGLRPPLRPPTNLGGGTPRCTRGVQRV
eukprot:4708297-Pyramimonas_sp.AAC.1